MLALHIAACLPSAMKKYLLTSNNYDNIWLYTKKYIVMIMIMMIKISTMIIIFFSFFLENISQQQTIIIMIMMIYYIIIIKDTNDANLSWHYKRIRWQSFNKQNCPRPVEEKLFLSFFPWKEVQRWTINRVFCPGSENHSELLWNLQELISTCPKTKTWSIHNTQYTIHKHNTH